MHGLMSLLCLIAGIDFEVNQINLFSETIIACLLLVFLISTPIVLTELSLRDSKLALPYQG
jgi:uncharacterized membrane protein